MHVIFEHQGDGRSGPEQCRDWAVEQHDWLEAWPHRRRDSAMSHAHDVERVWTDKLENKRVDLPGRSRKDAPGLANVDVLTVEPETVVDE